MIARAGIIVYVIANSSTQSTPAKKCLILSDGPVPTPEHTKVEGGGLRSWGLARGVKNNDPNIEVTIAYNEAYRKPEKFTKDYEGIHIQTWSLDHVPDLLSEFDTVIVSYCMGELSVVVANSVRPDQQLILDCYVPIYVEVSARQSDDMDAEYSAFSQDVPRWGHVLRRGDLFMCANEAQKEFYEGVLAGLGRINPATYGEELIRVVPYGIYKEKAVQKEHVIQKLIGPDHEKYRKVLWFGGIYPWFDLKDLIDAVAKIDKDVPTKLIIVGAKNPFNTHPDFVRKYDELIAYIKDNKLGDTVLVQDWVSFESRADWYLDSDLVVVINKIGQENNLAWRTRLVDFTWANLPIITNGGDPVSNLLEQANATALFTGLTSDAMANDIATLFKDEKKMTTIKKNLEKVRESLYWDNVTKPIADDINRHTQPADFSKYGFYDTVAPASGVKSKLARISRKVGKVPAYAKKYGLRNTYHAVGSVVERRIQKHLTSDSAREPRIVIVSHQLDMSGAPFIIMDFAVSLKKAYPALPVDFYTFNPAHHENIVKLNKAGIRPKILTDRDAVINFAKGDVVVFNTAAHSNPLKWDVFSKLESGYLSKLIWYVHEDEPELIFNGGEANKMKSLMKDGKLEILTAAVMTRDHYRKYFEDDDHINIQSYQVITPEKYHRTLKAKDFSDKLSFVLPGTVGDGRKGQMPIFYAFAEFMRTTYSKNPKKYRDFELVYVGLTDDFLSRQLMRQADAALGSHFVGHGRVTKEEVLDIISNSNVTICYSIRECLPLFVFEGMIMGHPILRNDCSGIDEQLVDGKNGLYLESKDYGQVVDTIEKILNKETTSDKTLEKMSKTGYDISLKQEKNDYSAMITLAKDALNGGK
jgi:glycosyltransferase involved in cell wall biosynthesis